MRLLDAAAIEAAGDWAALTEHLLAAHRTPKAAVRDLLMRAETGDQAWLTRAAWVPGGDLGLKSVTVFPGNPQAEPPRPSVNGAFLLFSSETGEVEAVLDGAALTAWKTVADSALGARLLAREDVETLLVVGAGAIAERLPEAWLAVRPGLRRVRIWNRSPERAEALAARLAARLPVEVRAAPDLEAAVREADAMRGGDGATQLDFETLTFAPIDRRLIVRDMLDEGERAWLDAYHAACRDRIGPRLSDTARAWLERQSEPL